MENLDKLQDENNIEIFKLRKTNAHLYELPPLESLEGHSSDDFQTLVFRGDMKMTQKGDLLIVYFLNEDESVFAFCLIDTDINKHIIRARNSSRYFTLKIIDAEGTEKYLGLVFKQRNDAFDFYDTASTFKSKVALEETIETTDKQPKIDFSLKAVTKEKKEGLGKFKFSFPKN